MKNNPMDQTDTKMTSRRDLFKKTAIGGVSLAAASLMTACSKSETKKPIPPPAAAPTPSETPKAAAPGANDGLPYVDVTSNKAKALKYVEDAAQVPASVRGDKGATKGADQFCNNCQFNTGKSGSGIKCALFPGKAVKPEGWCVSWSLKAQS